MTHMMYLGKCFLFALVLSVQCRSARNNLEDAFGQSESFPTGKKASEHTRLHEKKDFKHDLRKSFSCSLTSCVNLPNAVSRGNPSRAVSCRNPLRTVSRGDPSWADSLEILLERQSPVEILFVQSRVEIVWKH